MAKKKLVLEKDDMKILDKEQMFYYEFFRNDSENPPKSALIKTGSISNSQE